MDENKFFMHRIRRTSGTYDKGIEVHDSYNAAKQSYHAYLGAYAYGRHNETDYVQASITDMNGRVMMQESWIAPVEPEQV